MQRQPVVAWIAGVAVRVPSCGAQMQLYIAIDKSSIGASQHRVTEVGASAAAAPSLEDHAKCLAAFCLERRSAPHARRPARRQVSLAPAGGCWHYRFSFELQRLAAEAAPMGCAT